MPLNVFIDTEFTDFLDPQLISIGMVTDTGDEFYAELPVDAQACSQFVQETVIPQLGKDSHALMSKDALSTAIMRWLEHVRRNHDTVVICYDFQIDWDLFYDVLDTRVPPWCQHRLVAVQISELLRYEYRKKHGYSAHHALHDARANCYAFRETRNKS
jgi:hypothetical protein